MLQRALALVALSVLALAQQDGAVAPDGRRGFGSRAQLSEVLATVRSTRDAERALLAELDNLPSELSVLVAGALEVAFYQSLFIFIVFMFAAPWLLAVPSLEHVPAIVLAAVLATMSLFLLSWAYARAEANYLAPTEYTGFLWATLWGWVVFDEGVSLFTVAGAALIVGGCIIAARRRDHAPVADTEAQI